MTTWMRKATKAISGFAEPAAEQKSPQLRVFRSCCTASGPPVLDSLPLLPADLGEDASLLAAAGRRAPRSADFLGRFHRSEVRGRVPPPQMQAGRSWVPAASSASWTSRSWSSGSEMRSNQRGGAVATVAAAGGAERRRNRLGEEWRGRE
ncbi:uncharacterized protein LOC144095195 [Amblyomma americanum]